MDLIFQKKKGFFMISLNSRFIQNIFHSWKIFIELVLCTVLGIVVSRDLIAKNHNNSNYTYTKTFEKWETTIYTGSNYDLDDVEEKIVGFIQKNPHNPFPYYLMSTLYLKKAINSTMDATGSNGSYLRKSMELTQNLVETYPSLDLGYITMAESLFMLSQSEQAKDLLHESLIVVENPSWRIYFELSKIYFEHDVKRSSSYIEQALSFNDSNIDVLVPVFIDILVSKYPLKLQSKISSDKNLSSLIKELKHWNELYPHPAFLEKIGTLLVEQKNYKLAHLYLTQAYKSKNPLYLYGALLDSKIMYENLNKIVESKKLLSSILNLKYIDRYPQVKQIAGLYLGHIELISKNTQEAKKYFASVLKDGFSNDFIGNSLLESVHTMYKGCGYTEEYAQFLSELLDSSYLASSVYAHLSKIYSEELSDHISGMEYITSAITLESSKPDYYVQAGIVLYRLNKMKSASEMFELAYKLNPLDATARYNYACTMALMGNIDTAYQSLQKAINLDPQLYLTAVNDSDLASLKKDPRFHQIEDTYTHLTSAPNFKEAGEEEFPDLDLDLLDQDILQEE